MDKTRTAYWYGNQDEAKKAMDYVAAYQAMKEALEDILKLDLTTWDDTGAQLDEAIDKAQKALTLANGGSTDE